MSSLMSFDPDELQDVRESRGLSKTEAALQIGVTPQTYDRWENGETSPTWSRHRRAVQDWLDSDTADTSTGGSDEQPEERSVEDELQSLAGQRKELVYRPENDGPFYYQGGPWLIGRNSEFVTAVMSYAAGRVREYLRQRGADGLEPGDVLGVMVFHEEGYPSIRWGESLDDEIPPGVGDWFSEFSSLP